MSSTARRLRLSAVSFAAALALTGCGMLGSGSASSDPEAPAGSASESAEDAAPGDTAASDEEGADISATTAEAAGLDPGNLPEPVSTATIPAVVENDPEATRDVALYGLHRQDGVVVGTYSFTVNSTGDEPDWLYGYLGQTGWHPFLIDTVNLTKHDVLEGEGRAQTDYQGPEFRPGQTYYAFAMFAAPPEDVTTMDAHVIDGFPAVSGVPIQ